MKIYFVRHGETNGNVGKRHQPEHTRLTFRGEAQAKIVGEQLQAVEPTHLFTSTQIRAVETASIMSQSVDMTPATSELFKELIRPAYVHGKKHRSIASVMYICMWFLGKRGGHGEKDGESRGQFYHRLQAAKEFLESLPEDAKVVVVSHSVFITLFIDFVLHEGKRGLLSNFRLFIKILTMKNTATTQLAIEKTQTYTRWRVVS